MIECPYCNMWFSGTDGLEHFDNEIKKLDNKLMSSTDAGFQRYVNTLTVVLARRRMLEMNMEINSKPRSTQP